MFRYIIRRVLIFIPTLFAVSMLAFVISINAPGDPVDALFSGANGNENGGKLSDESARQKDSLRHRLGLDLPVFYFTLSNVATPDTLYKIFDKNRHTALERMIDTYGDWDEISAWDRSVERMKQLLAKVKPDSVAYQSAGKDKVNDDLDRTQQQLYSLQASYEDVVIASKLEKLRATIDSYKSLGAEHNFFAVLDAPLTEAKSRFEQMKQHASAWKNYIPSVKFYGYNQYHRWLFGDGNWLTGKGCRNTEGVIRGDFGISYSTKRPVTATITRALPWSLFFTVLSVIFAYIISIPVGVQAAAKRGSIFDRSSSVVLFMLYSLPSFFMATLLLMTFANPSVFNIFPANGVKPAIGYAEGISLWEKMKASIPYLILPLICYTYSSLAFLSRTMRVAVLEVINQDFIRTAKAKGLNYYLVIYKHTFRNALLPIITVFANIFPAAVGGSVILEFIFGIPGMGQEILQGVQTKDYPMIVAVFTLSGFMTLIGYLVADILYAMADPRITYSKK